MDRVPLRTPFPRRRALAMALAALLPALFGSFRAGASDRVHRIAIMFWQIPPSDLAGAIPRFPGARQLRATLAELGWREGHHFEILWRSAQGNASDAERLMRELVGMPVDLIAVSGNDLIRVARRHTSTIPIVTIVSTAPVEAGFAKSLTRPGGNITGLVFEIDPEVNGKRLALLKEIAPWISTIAFLHDRDGGMTGGIDGQTEAAVRRLGLALLRYRVDRVDDLERSVADAVTRGAGALLVDTSVAAPAGHHANFHALAERHRLPALYTYAQAVLSGGLMFYGPKRGELYVRSAYYIDRILRGSKPGELPFEQPRTYELIVNRRAAAAIGLRPPASLLAQADEVID